MIPHFANPQTQNICITFVQCSTNVKDVGRTLYKCYTNVLCLLGRYHPPPVDGMVDSMLFDNAYIGSNIPSTLKPTIYHVYCGWWKLYANYKYNTLFYSIVCICVYYLHRMEWYDFWE